MSVRNNHRAGALVGKLFQWIPNRNRRVAQRNLELCLPQLSQSERKRLLADHLRATGIAFTELGLFWRKPKGQVMAMLSDVRGEEHLINALAKNKGVLLAAPHLGAWELLCHYLATTAPTVVLYREPRDPGIEQVINDGRSRFGAHCVRAGAHGVRELFTALRSGKIVGILPDQQPKRGNGEFAPFFGIPAFTMILLSRLAQKTGAPVVFGYVIRKRDGGYQLNLVPGDSGIASKDISASVQALNQQIESLVREAPEQYQWGYKRFSMRPDGEQRLYE